MNCKGECYTPVKVASHWVDHMMYPDLPFAVTGLNKEEAKIKTYQKFIKDYMRCAAAIDDNIGRLVRITWIKMVWQKIRS